jgi:hypothetical protein
MGYLTWKLIGEKQVLSYIDANDMTNYDGQAACPL